MEWDGVFGTTVGWRDGMAMRSGVLELTHDGGRGPLAQEQYSRWIDRIVAFGDGGIICARARLFSEAVATFVLNGCPDSPARIDRTCNHPLDSGFPPGPQSYESGAASAIGAWSTVTIARRFEGRYIFYLAVSSPREVYVDDVELRVSLDGTCP
jgi:hypothetical protein